MPKRKKSATLLSNEQLVLQGLEFINKKEQEKAITNELKVLRVPLEDAVMEIGSEDEKGNKYIILEHADKEIVLTGYKQHVYPKHTDNPILMQN